MYSIYFNQKVILKTIKETNDCGENTFNEVEIFCRFQYKSILVKSSSGNNTEAIAQIYTKNKCNIKDSIIHEDIFFTIVGVDQQVDFNGKTIYYIYYLNKG